MKRRDRKGGPGVLSHIKGKAVDEKKYKGRIRRERMEKVL